MPERSERGLSLRVHAIPHGAALHEDDWVMSVLARDGGRQSEDEPCLGPTRDLLKAQGRKVVTLIDHQMAVIAETVVDDALADHALNDGDVDASRGLVPAPADSAN